MMSEYLHSIPGSRKIDTPMIGLRGCSLPDLQSVGFLELVRNQQFVLSFVILQIDNITLFDKEFDMSSVDEWVVM